MLTIELQKSTASLYICYSHRCFLQWEALRQINGQLMFATCIQRS